MIVFSRFILSFSTSISVAFSFSLLLSFLFFIPSFSSFLSFITSLLVLHVLAFHLFDSPFLPISFFVLFSSVSLSLFPNNFPTLLYLPITLFLSFTLLFLLLFPYTLCQHAQYAYLIITASVAYTCILEAGCWTPLTRNMLIGPDILWSLGGDHFDGFLSFFLCFEILSFLLSFFLSYFLS